MAGEWPSVPLGSLAAEEDSAIAIGPFGSAMKADVYVPHGVPIIRGTNISSTRELIGDWVYVPEAFADAMPRCVVRDGDLVFPHRGSIGEVALIPGDRERYFLSTSCMKITLNRQKADPRYVAYYFKSEMGRAEIMRFASQVGTPGIGQPLTSLRQFKLPAPPFYTQRAIANLLSALDDKIELNRRTAETLEAMAHALFKSWFVDFDPVHAKAKGHPTGLPDDLSASFPDSFGEDSLPRGWTVTPLSELADLQRTTAEPAGLGEATVDHYSLPAFDAGVWPASESASTIKSLKLALNPPLVLFSKLNPEIPRVWPVLGSSGRSMLASTEFLALKPRFGRATLAYLASLLSSDAFRERAAGMVTGTSKSHQRVQPTALLQCACIAPNAAILSAFDKVNAPILSRIDGIRRENVTLAALRDTLLPKLISGELRIAGAEEQVSAA